VTPLAGWLILVARDSRSRKENGFEIQAKMAGIKCVILGWAQEKPGLLIKANLIAEPDLWGQRPTDVLAKTPKGVLGKP